MQKKIRVRFAPSPTGPFHIGGARSALFNWLLAKHMNGDFIVRIEDTDTVRSTKESEENIKESLKWLGLNWDEGIDVGGPHAPYRQTERLEKYKKIVEQLIKEDKAYYAYDTAEELEASRQAQLKEGKTPVYQGYCKNLTAEEQKKYKEEGRKPVVRLRVPTHGVFEFDDMVRGHVEFQASGVGDFIIMKSDGIPVYNFAVVIDDIDMEITHVIRAEEHLSNTPRQIAIYQALGHEAPVFGHISLILGSDHKKMSKRHGATSITSYKDMGYLPDAIVNYLALLGWAPEGEEEIFTRNELIEKFTMNRVSSNDAVFDIEKLNWINSRYIKELSPDQLLEFLIPFIVKVGYETLPISPERKEWLKKVVCYVQERLSYGMQVEEELKIFYRTIGEIKNEEYKEIMKSESSKKILQAFIENLEKLDLFEDDFIKKCFTNAMKTTNIKGKLAFEPVRIALTGKTKGPGIYTMISLFGKDKTLNLLKKGLTI